MTTELIECQTAKQLVDELDPGHNRWSNGGWTNNYIFRGQADLDWQLIPAALRTNEELVSEQMVISRSIGAEKIGEDFLRAISEKSTDHDPEHVRLLLIQLYSEITNLRQFFELAGNLNLNSSLPLPSEFHNFSEVLAQEYIANLGKRDYIINFWNKPAIAIAQHHGVATRLLDWTRNPMYAAFFASENLDKSTTHIAIYAIDPNSLNSSIRLIEVSGSYSQYIHSQEGVFTFDTEADLEFVKTGKWRSFLDVDQGTVYKLTLPVSELNELTRILWLRRVTRAHMMPNLDNIIPALNSKLRGQGNSLKR